MNQTQPATTASGLRKSPSEIILKGHRISTGLASGTVWVLGDVLDRVGEAYRIEPDQIQAEMERIRLAFGHVEAELEEAALRLSEQIDHIFQAHQLMLENLLASNEFETELRGSLTSASEAVKKVFGNWQAKFAAIETETIRQRADDILDLARRVLRRLEGTYAFGLTGMSADSILVTIARGCSSAKVSATNQLSHGKSPGSKTALVTDVGTGNSRAAVIGKRTRALTDNEMKNTYLASVLRGVICGFHCR